LKLIRFWDDQKICHGNLEGETVIEVDPPGTDWCDSDFVKTGRRFDFNRLRLLSPCHPSKVICLGLNYRTHAEEFNLPLPEVPIIFLKPSTAVIGPGEAIVHPPHSRRVDYEAELAVVIGRRACRVKSSEALEYVFGYSCANDVTARDKQPAKGQWTYAKSFDTFCPLGPVIETEIEDPEALQIKGLLNGSVVQEASTADHHFKVVDIIEFVTGCMTLLPGDVIITGTPSGVGSLKPGDSFGVTIEGIGTLNNPVIEA